MKYDKECLTDYYQSLEKARKHLQFLAKNKQFILNRSAILKVQGIQTISNKGCVYCDCHTGGKK